MIVIYPEAVIIDNNDTVGTYDSNLSKNCNY